MSRSRPNVQTPQRGASSVDRLPPHSAEAEAGVLGCCLLAPNECVAKCVAKFTAAGAEVFYDLRHREVFHAMATMIENLVAVDVITLLEELKRRDRLEQVGGMAFVATLPDTVPSALNLPYYLDIVWEMFLRRRMSQVCRQCAELVERPDRTGSIGEVLDKCEAEVLGVRRMGSGGTEARGLTAIIGEAVQRIEDIRRGVGLILGIRTHFGHLDKWTAGLHRKQITLIAARPGMGKTALAMGIAENVARKERIGVGVFSMEMEDIDLVLRMLCKEAEVDSHRLRTGFASNEEYERIPEAGKQLTGVPIWVDSSPGLGILELKARARRMVSAHPEIGVFVIDYLQLAKGTRSHGDNRALELGEISAGVLELGKELNVAMLVLSQLNRETEKQKNRKPQLSDIRESGAIEQDASTVLLLYRPKGADDEPEDGSMPEVIRVNALIAKQRHGPTEWDVEFLFHRKFTRFEDAYQNQGHLPVEGTGPSRTGQEEGRRGETRPEDLPTNQELGLE